MFINELYEFNIVLLTACLKYGLNTYISTGRINSRSFRLVLSLLAIIAFVSQNGIQGRKGILYVRVSCN
jgi:hypothetical protein